MKCRRLDGRGDGGDTEVHRVVVAEQRDVESCSCRRAERVELFDVLAGKEQRARRAGDVRRQHIDTLHHPADDASRDRDAQTLNGRRHRVDPPQSRLLAHCSKMLADTAEPAFGVVVANIHHDRAGTN
jgi:hypothetical protein